MKRRGFFGAVAAAIGATAAAALGVRAAAAAPVFEGRVGVIDGMVIHRTGRRLVWSRDSWSRFEGHARESFAAAQNNIRVLEQMQLAHAESARTLREVESQLAASAMSAAHVGASP